MANFYVCEFWENFSDRCTICADTAGEAAMEYAKRCYSEEEHGGEIDLIVKNESGVFTSFCVEAEIVFSIYENRV